MYNQCVRNIYKIMAKAKKKQKPMKSRKSTLKTSKRIKENNEILKKIYG